MAQKKDFIGKVEVRQQGKTGASDDRLPIDDDVKGHHTAVKSKSDDQGARVAALERENQEIREELAKQASKIKAKE